jgi:hypothetical protein
MTARLQAGRRVYQIAAGRPRPAIDGDTAGRAGIYSLTAVPRTVLGAIAIGLLALAAACHIDAAYDGTMYQCPDGKCPPGYSCVNGQCVRDVDAMSPAPDAAPGTPDAAPIPGAGDPRLGNVLFFTFDDDPPVGVSLDRSPNLFLTKQVSGHTSTGALGDAWSFDDFDDGTAEPEYVRIPDSSRLFLGNRLTIEAWIELDEDQNQAIYGDFDAAGTPQVEYSFEVTAGGGLAFYSNSCADKNTRVAMSTKVAIPLAMYTHVAVTWDGSEVRFYVGGALIETVPFAHEPCESAAIREWRLGRRVDGSNAFDGEIDELKVSSYPKDPSAIPISMTHSAEAASTCGDALIEGTEACDGTSTCCSPDTCAFEGDGVACAAGTCSAGVCQSLAGRVADGLVALYPFDEGTGDIVSDQSKVGTALDLTIGDPTAVTWQTGALTLDASTVVRSTGAADKIASACQAANELTVETWLAPANLTQTGPARIVTMSFDAGLRNFTLGQSADSFIMRLRTTASDGNGEPLAPSLQGDVSTALTHLVVTRDADGMRRMYIDGKLRSSSRVDGTFATWDSSWSLGLGNELSAADDRTWLGTFHLVAVYCRALSDVEVAQNFVAGADPAL